MNTDVTPDRIVPGEGQPGEKRTINGRLWEWSNSPDMPEYHYWGTRNDDGIAPAVMCACGGTTFQISYGSYECRAHCGCGRSFIIYDG